MKKDGSPLAISMRQYSDAGACASTQEFMMQVGTNTMSIVMNPPSKKYDGSVVVTNHVPSGSFRGYGYLESTLLVTQAIFEACEKADLDPMVFIEKNAMGLGERYYNPMAGRIFGSTTSHATGRTSCAKRPPHSVGRNVGRAGASHMGLQGRAFLPRHRRMLVRTL